MRSMIYGLMACAGAIVVAGCYTSRPAHDSQGRPYGGPEVYYGGYEFPGYETRGDGIVEGLNRGVNTNWFGPVDAGANAARAVGTASGQ